MIKYQVKAMSKERLDSENKSANPDGSYDFWGAILDTEEEAIKYGESLLSQDSKHWALYKVFPLEINHSNNQAEAEREGYKSFWVNIYEEAKYVKQYWAKDKEALETDEASELISEDYGDGHFEWKNGQEDWEIFEDDTPRAVKG